MKYLHRLKEFGRKFKFRIGVKKGRLPDILNEKKADKIVARNLKKQKRS